MIFGEIGRRLNERYCWRVVAPGEICRRKRVVAAVMSASLAKHKTGAGRKGLLDATSICWIWHVGAEEIYFLRSISALVGDIEVTASRNRRRMRRRGFVREEGSPIGGDAWTARQSPSGRNSTTFSRC